MPPTQQSPASTERRLPDLIKSGHAITALAPMQDVTNRPFMKVISEFGSPDYFFTEYFRVHVQSNLEKHILDAIVDNQTRRPVFAQMIGEDIHHLVRATKELLKHNVAGIDLNMGCPAPTVYKKDCGGGLLRDPDKIDRVLGALRDVVPGLFTVKMRIGFEDTRNFETILQLINKRQVDLLSLHGRTVKEKYRSDVHYDCIKQAANAVNCPLLANGDIWSASKAKEILEYTGAAGVMIGRHAIRNPWIFKQIREMQSGEPLSRITLPEVHSYIKRLYTTIAQPWMAEKAAVNKLKKHLNFIGQGVDPEGKFLYEARRAQSEAQLEDICNRHLQKEAFFADQPFEGVLARPNCE